MIHTTQHPTLLLPFCEVRSGYQKKHPSSSVMALLSLLIPLSRRASIAWLFCAPSFRYVAREYPCTDFALAPFLPSLHHLHILRSGFS
jgi:hypothetical protein